MSSVTKPASAIELSTVYFCEGPVPPTISLRDCGLQLKGAHPEALTAFYGNQSKQDGFMAAREYAEKNRLQFTVIDFLVALDHRINPGLMKPDELANHDFIAFQRLSRSAADEIQNILQSGVPGNSSWENAADPVADGLKPNQLVLESPDVIDALTATPALRHVKVIAHQAKLLISEKVLTVGSVPFFHWGAIVEASCRLNPTTRVALDGPGKNDKPSEKSTLAPAPGARAKSKVPRPR
ncbi:hypothetical protein HF313_22955 [Massilia atriviolacea]|uniref:Uncharacterized protein n=1 Tax=Massilia atriviolacea TaxID=2495579 RepID=A0A430HCJ5_9BURK|nr:hypothetical protein [Massilia atriviolacea]RSZ55258.1 hypothetical protein EJB06_30505 [Massilia atriviolacea]